MVPQTLADGPILAQDEAERVEFADTDLSMLVYQCFIHMLRYDLSLEEIMISDLLNVQYPTLQVDGAFCDKRRAHM